ncbi:hypothetical protein [Streptomyces sparsogenes]|uniref:Uncharacterized protein n=1 Tax=Streptomyces sparsogenes DSM 40356 TaxID=1331668 RepID=A0A1R1SDG8_9ACTN|nr:hypothetical protein SPAR_25941 [Streptomyces sparsogenes DSM 40356]
MDASVDRIAQPWGGRTPYDRHGEWPTRVDTFLAEGVEPEAVRRWVQTASLLHSDGDAMDIAVADPASKQPLFKTAAAALRRVERGDGHSAPAPTTTASAPARADAAPATAGGPTALATQRADASRDHSSPDHRFPEHRARDRHAPGHHSRNHHSGGERGEGAR